MECTWYPEKRTLVVINNSGEPVSTRVFDGEGGTVPVSVGAHGLVIMNR